MSVVQCLVTGGDLDRKPEYCFAIVPRVGDWLEIPDRGKYEVTQVILHALEEPSDNPLVVVIVRNC